MKPAVWTGWRPPSDIQQIAVNALGFDMVADHVMQDTDNVSDALRTLHELARRTGARACFGQYSPDVRLRLSAAVLTGLACGRWPDHSVICYGWHTVLCSDLPGGVGQAWLMNGILTEECY